MAFENLLKTWKKSASKLGFELITPFTLVFPSGNKVEPLCLLPDFGAPSGMLIFGEYHQVEPFLDEVRDAGYGFSVMSEPLESEIEACDYIDVLNDWGWSGDPDARPTWLEHDDHWDQNE